MFDDRFRQVISKEAAVPTAPFSPMLTGELEQWFRKLLCDSASFCDT